MNEGAAAVAARIAGINQASGEDDSPLLTDNFGHVLPTVTQSRQIGGYPVTSDSILMEKQQTFNRSKTLERMVHPGGSGAFGYFETTTGEAEKYCKASFLQGIGNKTPVFARFSTVTFGREFPDSGRNPRGFAVKFYTEDGNYDLVGLNWPIFFVRDPLLGPDVIRSQQRNPKNFLLNYDSMFDFFANVPESMHAATMFFSDHGTPVGWRFMDGFGCHTFKWVNAKDEAVYIKYHWVCGQEKKQFKWEEAVRMSGEDPDFAKRDLFEHIENGGEATWTLCVQLMSIDASDRVPFDPFDVTKVWPHSEFPLVEIGRLVLNRNPENYHRDIEQAAFSPGSLVTGIETSPDLLLNFRSFFYRDAQFHRLGVNLHEIPVNCPFMAKHYSPISRDGPLRTDSNGADNCHYVPNTVNKPTIDKSYLESLQPLSKLHDPVVSRKSPFRHSGDPSEYDQARSLFVKVMSDLDRRRMFLNIGAAIRFVKDPHVVERFLAQCLAIHPEYAKGVCDVLTREMHEQVSEDTVKDLSSRAHLGFQSIKTRI